MSVAKVLVIEDDPEIRESIVDALEYDGFDVADAKNGRVGVELAKSYLPDMILCDVMMPELDGFGVLVELSQDVKLASIPFIFLTAKAARDDVRKGMALGADDYITKPFTSQELLEGVHSRLERHKIVKAQASENLTNLHRYINLHLPHELRTPLTGMMGYLHLLQSGFDDLPIDQVKMMLGAIEHSSNRLYHLVENYLAYAQLQVLASNDELVSRLKKHGLNRHPDALVLSVVENIAYQAGRLGDLDLNLNNAQVVIFDDHLKKLTEELTKNAFSFSRDGTPVRLEATRDSDTYIIRVTNEGRGMTLEQIDAIDVNVQFERERYEQQGAGLGLVICQGIVEIYDGELTIESEPGEWISVSASFPVAN